MVMPGRLQFFHKTVANSQTAKMKKFEFLRNTCWMITFIHAEYYGIEVEDTVTAINCVFTAGSWEAG